MGWTRSVSSPSVWPWTPMWPVPAAHAAQSPLTVVPNTVNMFRDTRAANDVGIGQGESFQYGADLRAVPPGQSERRVSPRPAS